MQLTHNWRPRAFPICIQAAFVCSLLLATPAEVDIERQRRIEYALAHPRMLHDTAITWQSADWWLREVAGEPGMARAAFAELGFTAAETLLHAQTVVMFDRLEDAKGWRDQIFHRAANSGREMDSGERQRYLEFEGQAVQLDDSLELARSRFLREITAGRLQRFNRWLREQRFLEIVVGSKVGQAFYGQINYGPGYNDAPDSLGSALRLLESSQSYRELVEWTAESAYRSLPGLSRLARSDSAKVIGLLRDYRAQIVRARAELAVADMVAFGLAGPEAGPGNEPVRSLMNDRVRLVKALKAGLLTAVGEAVGVPADRLGAVWIP